MPNHIYLTAWPTRHVIHKSNTPTVSVQKVSTPAPAPQTQTVRKEAMAMADYDLTPVDRAWNKILDRVNVLMEREPIGGRTREQIMAAALRSDTEMRNLYTVYEAAQRGLDPDKMAKSKYGAKTLRQFADENMRKIEEAIQTANPTMNGNQVMKAAFKDRTYKELYMLYEAPEANMLVEDGMAAVTKRDARLRHQFPENFGD